MCDIVEVHDTSIIVVLTRYGDLVEVGRVHVSDGMLIGVPSAKAHVETAHESGLAVNNAQLLMMGPIENHIVCDAVDTF